MKAEDFQGIVAGLEDAIAFVNGDTTRSRVAARPACPGEGRGDGDPRQDPAQPSQVRRQTARPPSPPCAIGNNTAARPRPC